MKDRVSRILKECETCQVANRKNKGGVEFVTSSRKGEMFAIDNMEIGEPRRCVLVGIDYYTRHLRAKILEKRTSEEIVGVLEEWFTQNYLPEALISDNAKEFISLEFEKWCSMNEIEHRKISVEAHGSNGRIERAIRTIRESVFKLGDVVIESVVERAVIMYNETYHSGLKCIPNEEFKEGNKDVEIKWRNTSEKKICEKLCKANKRDV
ncbi:hypothetical protein NGRA_3472 [Nosema granulosis]|uniref:Integrase catalytic domain-containing protein n=1 Tax=Nosema granulosis TaxID=83296 RepID=A0A9P6GVR4_9MICR|nr:hypothetical protein NGRA_3472 [Nosema granulosis]